MNLRYSRQMLFPNIGEAGQKKLLNSKVLVVGVGALGTVIANHLVRAGVGYVRMVDRDYVEKSNLQRQMLFDEDDVIQSMPKAIAAKRRLEKINSDVVIEAIIADASIENIELLLDNIDIVIDGTDNFETRFLLNDACFKNGIPFVYGGAVSSRGMSAMFIPQKTPCLRCYISTANQSGQTCDMIGVISPVVDIVASYQVTEAIKYLVEDFDHLRNSLLTFDIWQNHSHEIKFHEPKEHCPTCQLHEYPALSYQKSDKYTVLCGRETVQIQSSQPFDLNEWAKKLQSVGKVKITAFLLKVELNEKEKIVLFPDGRTLVQGTEDLTRAKSLYSRYIGT